MVKQVAVTPPTPESAGCVFKKNNAIFVCLENGREGEISWRKISPSLVSDCGKQENEET